MKNREKIIDGLLAKLLDALRDGQLHNPVDSQSQAGLTATIPIKTLAEIIVVAIRKTTGDDIAMIHKKLSDACSGKTIPQGTDMRQVSTASVISAIQALDLIAAVADHMNQAHLPEATRPDQINQETFAL
jgi:nitrogen fixation protein